MSREIDERIAREVFGFEVIETDECNGTDNFWLKGQVDAFMGHPRELPHYSTDIKDAWEVVIKFWKEGSFKINLDSLGIACSIYKGRGLNRSEQYQGGHISSAPMAICLAALNAVKEKERE